MNIPKYPEDFYDFKNGVDISNQEINQWIQQCINKLEENEDWNSYSISSGNTYVCVNKGCEGLKYDIMVSKSHADAQIWE